MNHVGFGTYVDLAGALILAGLGVWLIWLKPRRRTTVWLAAFSMLMGTGYALRNGAHFVAGIDASESHWLSQVATFSVLGAALVLVPLATRLPRPMHPSERSLLWLPAAVAGGFLLLRLVMEADGTAGAPGLIAGFLGSFGGAQVLLRDAFLFALLLLPLRTHRWAVAGEDASLLRQAALVAAALTLFPALQIGLFAFSVLDPRLLAFVVAATLWLRVMLRIGADGDAAAAGRRGARNVALLSLAVPLAGRFALVTTGASVVALVTSGMFGVARTLTVLLLAYAILRHELLDLDVKVRWTVSKTTVAGVFVVVFFIVSEGAALVFSDLAGNEWLGIVAAGALLFVLAPLQRLGDGIAARAVPASDVEETYRVAVAKFLADDQITREEEGHLARLAARLGIDAERAFEIQEKVQAGRASGGV